VSSQEWPPAISPAAPQLRIAYRSAPIDELLADPRALAVLGFGQRAPATHSDPRYFNVGLESLGDATTFEIWTVDAEVETGRDDDVSWSRAGDLAFGAMAIRETAHQGIAGASEFAYTRLFDWLAESTHPVLLRSWNYLDAICEGAGDAERYRQFCVGRARGIAGRLDAYPAATAIGLRDGARVLRVYWLAGRIGGVAVENPRQVAAWRYPRQYGPQPPSFSRATLPDAASLPLLLSGTASVVGHASLHRDSLTDQIDETFRNFGSLLQAARAQRPGMPQTFGSDSVLKVYVRDVEDAPRISSELELRLPASTQRLLLAADICRPELRIEIDGFHS
jgi:chorismate lyase/3-hydroxybenzoate synthase